MEERNDIKKQINISVDIVNNAENGRSGIRRLYSSSIRNGEIASSPHNITATREGKYSFLTDNKNVRASGGPLREGF